MRCNLLNIAIDQIQQPIIYIFGTSSAPFWKQYKNEFICMKMK